MIGLILALFLIVVFAGAVYLVRAVWRDYVRLDYDDKEFQKRVATLNDSQSHRLTDMQLITPSDPDIAWSQMVRRGLRRRSQRYRKASRL